MFVATSGKSVIGDGGENRERASGAALNSRGAYKLNANDRAEGAKAALCVWPAAWDIARATA